ncbi:DUF7549 family protein [Halobaculum magnesiiphilum]|uniref:TIGR04206 family protein n=1 Tax=Halobaculum magnesiiphilum TaxID=1017351 RepID=A0A8T8WD46_9EURY|nr:hypothetical protein [Halobaculum magnesiiphilum]QZP37792.1 hypothetical protein K6T50_01020 [Halobaculum magnesiiphilum]
MVWVRSEYAGELAVLSTWVAALLPWNVFYGAVAGGSVLFVRFPLFQIRYAFGLPFVRATSVSSPVSAFLLQSGTSVQVAYGLWLVGAAVYLVALVISVYYYREEERAESWGVDPVDVLGGLLVASAVLFLVASVLLPERFFGIGFGIGGGIPGVSIPVGAVLQLVLGGVLLRADRVN